MIDLKEYRHRPLIIRAVRWFPGVEVPGVRYHPAVVGEYGDVATAPDRHGHAELIYPGDWLIQDKDGQHWSSLPHADFMVAYIPVDPEETFDEREP